MIIISLYGADQLVFINKKQHVFSEAGTDFLSILYFKVQSSKGPAKI
jgi:hypothetical protein